MMITPAYAGLALFTNSNIDDWYYPDNYDNNNVSSLDMLILLQKYGSYDGWFAGDFNHDFEINNADMNILLKYNGHTLPAIETTSHRWDHGILYTAPNNELKNWYNHWCCVKEFPYIRNCYSCGCFATDFELAFMHDYNYSIIEDAIIHTPNYAHSITVVYAGGNPYNDSSWRLFTSNSARYPTPPFLNQHDYSSRYVFLSEDGISSFPYLLWNANEHIAEYREDPRLNRNISK